MDFMKLRKIYDGGIKKAMNDEGITQGIMLFIVAAIMLAVLLPVLSGVISAVPTYTTDPELVNMTANGTTTIHYVLASAGMATAQSSVNSTIGSSYGLLVVVLILVAAATILGAIGLFRYFGGQD
jgi:hypothetical protein